MVRGYLLTGVILLLIGLVLTGCSVRHPTFVPETELVAAEADSIGVEAFLELPVEDQTERRERAHAALEPLRATESMQANMDLWLTNPLAWTPYATYRVMPSLGDVLEHLDAALALDPTRADVWLTRGRLLDVVGDERRARESFDTAWELTERIPDLLEDPDRIRRDIAVAGAWIERDAGWFDEGLTLLARVDGPARDDDAEYQVLLGLLLAGRGDLEAAMRVSYGVPAVELPVVGQMGRAGFLGQKKESTDLLKRWLQAEVWLRRGEPDLAWHVLGDLPYYRRVVPLAHRLWQDLGLYAEVTGDGRANMYYALSYLRRPFRRSYMPVPLTSDPVIRGLPKRTMNFYRLDTGGYHGGSLIGFAASATMMALDRGIGMGAERRYLQAQAALNVCIRRGVYPEEALALRGRLRFSRGYYVLAEMDLASARASFVAQDDVDPWTSYLLGLISMGRDRPDEAIALLEEAVDADRQLAGAWNALGVARLQTGEAELARLALNRAVELDPTNHQVWYNRGLLRCQIGDLDGGIEDFEHAAGLDPYNESLVRVIQLANVSRRQGRAFLPGTDVLGNWSPAGVDVHAHEDGEFAPQSPLGDEVWAKHLEDVLTEGLEEAGLLARAEGFDAQQLASLELEYERDPTPERRKVLAFGFAWHDLPEESQQLLAPYWGLDLDKDEMLLLLWLDQRLGEERRMAQLARQMNKDASVEFDHFRWSIEALSMLGEDNLGFERQSGFARFDIRARSMSKGGQYGMHTSLQFFRIHHRIGDGRRDGLLVSPTGRIHYLSGSGGTSISSTPRGK